MGVVKEKASLPFPLETVGTYSCHGVEPGMRQGETSAKINQDRGCVCSPFEDTAEYFRASLRLAHPPLSRVAKLTELLV